MRSNTPNAMILSKDTGTWVYGLALMELGLVSDKNVLVKQGFSNEYVSINLGVRLITGFPGLSTIKYPVCCIVALYVLTGCDLLVLFFVLLRQLSLNISYSMPSIFVDHLSHLFILIVMITNCLTVSKFLASVDLHVHLT